MELLCAQKELAAKAQALIRSIPSRTTLPILTGIHLLASEDKLEMRATDMDIGISVAVPASVIDPGEVVVPGRYFSEIVKRAPVDEIKLSSAEDGSKLTVAYGVSYLRVNCFPVDEFPWLAQVAGIAEEIAAMPSALKRILQQVSVSMIHEAGGQTSVGSVYSGALLEMPEDGILRLCSTDTHRLTLVEERAAEGILSRSIIVPGKCLTEVGRLLDEAGEKVTIAVFPSQIRWNIGEFQYTSRLLQGQFPPYQSVIPQRWLSRLVVQRDPLLGALERANFLAQDQTHLKANIVKFAVFKSQLCITTSASEVASLYEEVESELEGEEVEIAFNARYLIDALKVIQDEKVVIIFNGSEGPAVVRPAESEGFICLVLPIRLR